LSFSFSLLFSVFSCCVSGSFWSTERTTEPGFFLGLEITGAVAYESSFKTQGCYISVLLKNYDWFIYNVDIDNQDQTGI